MRRRWRCCKRWCWDLNVPVELRVCATVRDADGLALSSRNRYLSGEERVQALALSRALTRVQEMVASGVCESGKLREAMLHEMRGLRVDYAEVVDRETLLPVASICGGALVAVAAWVGETRLIDNLVIARRG